METAAKTPVMPKDKKGPSTLLIGVLIVLLIGTALGAYFYLKPKTEDSDEEGTTADEDEDEGGASGREVADNHFEFTPDQIAAMIANTEITPTPGKPGESPENPIYIKDPTYLAAVEKMAISLQVEGGNNGVMDAIRSSYDIGQPMMGRDQAEQECIEELFEKLPNVDFSQNPDRKYLAFPVYGTDEINGSVYRAELQSIIDSGWQGLNLTKLRHNNHPGWCKEIGLNLLVGTTWSNTPTVNHVRMSWAPRSELDFFKKFNRCWVADAHLADKYVNKNNSNQIVLSATHPDARAAYCATAMFEFVQRWIREIDRLDEVTREAAAKALAYSEDNPTGWHVTLINPNTGTKGENKN